MSKKSRVYKLIHGVEFKNTTESGLTLPKVHEKIISFMNDDPRANYNLMIGTDCQVHNGHTTFITGIIIQRVGRGAWACYRQIVVPRELESVKEKLSMETAYSEEVAMFFTGDKRSDLEDVILPFVYQGASLDFYIDVDAGVDPKINKTAPFVAEMVLRVESMGMKARIKPDAVAACAYADKHSKKPHSGFLVSPV